MPNGDGTGPTGTGPVSGGRGPSTAQGGGLGGGLGGGAFGVSPNQNYQDWAFPATIAHPLPFSSTELQTIQIVLRVSACLSVLGALSIIGRFCWAKKSRTVTNRLVVFMSVADLLGTIAVLFADLPFRSKQACSWQGFFIQTSLSSSMLWTLAMSCSIVYCISCQRPLRDSLRMEKYYHLICWIVPIIIGIILLNVRGNGPGVPGQGRGPMFAPAGMWCWIGANYQTYRMGFFYGPLWATVIINLAAYIWVGWGVWMNDKRLRRFSLNKHYGKPGNAITALRPYILKTSCYLIAFLINWSAPTVNRLQNIVEPNKPIFALVVLHAAFAPLQGFLNALIYFWATPRFFRTFFHRRKTFLKKPAAKRSPSTKSLRSATPPIVSKHLSDSTGSEGAATVVNSVVGEAEHEQDARGSTESVDGWQAEEDWYEWILSYRNMGAKDKKDVESQKSLRGLGPEYIWARDRESAKTIVVGSSEDGHEEMKV